MTDLEAKKILYVLESAYPRSEFRPGTATIYCEMLKDLPHEVVSEAVRRLIATSKWLPTVAEIRRACMEIIEPLPSAEAAWVEACAAARAFTPYQSAQKEPAMSPLTHKAVQVMGGIEAIAYSDQPELIGREFRRVYERLRESEMLVRQQGRVPIRTALPESEG